MRYLLSLVVLLYTTNAAAWPTIIAFGDSITEGTGDEQNRGGYPTRLQPLLRAGRYPAAVVVNRGQSGELTGSGVTRIEEALAQGGDLVLLMEGTNDVFHRVSVETIRFNLSQMARKAQQRNIPAVYATIVPQKPTAVIDPQNVITSQVAAAIRSLAASESRTVSDPFNVYLGTPNIFRDYYRDWPQDPVGHPNAAGYDLLASAFSNTISTSNAIPSFLLTIDSPAALSINTSTLQFSGWTFNRLAASGTGVSSVQIWAFPRPSGAGILLGQATLGMQRSDVAAAFGSQFVLSGFTMTGTPLPYGAYNITAYARGSVSGAIEITKTLDNIAIVESGTSIVNRYRLYSDITKEHHFTTSRNEYDALGRIGWVQEGVGHRILANNATFLGATPIPLYRMYHPAIFQHLWTTDINEYNILGGRGWIQEGIDGYCLPHAISARTVPLYRLAHPQFPLHHWTTDLNEYETLGRLGWIQQGYIGHVIP